MADPKPASFAHGDDIYAMIKSLQERIAQVDPALVIALSFGPRDKAPKALGDERFERVGTAAIPTGDAVATFRNYWSNEDTGGFSNVFTKHGDGFINIHTVAEA